MPERLRVRVCEVGDSGPRSVEVDLPWGATVLDALRATGWLPSDAALPPMGIFGRPVPPTQVLVSGDRVECYHPLPVDPRTRRRQRAQRARQAAAPSAGGD